MRKLTMFLLVVMLLTVVGCSNNINNGEVDTTTSQTTKQTEITSTDSSQLQPENPFEEAEMPKPFENVGGDENWGFSMRYPSRFSAIDHDIFEYLGWIDDEGYKWDYINAIINEKFGTTLDNVDRLDLLSQSKLTEYESLFWYIIEFDIPDEVIIDAIRTHNERLWSYVDENTYMPGFLLSIFTDEDIEALISRCEATVTAQFAEETAIVIEDRAFSPAWLYLHTSEAYEEVGITPEMVEEKLELYAEFNFTDEADEAFSEKLSEFLGEEVSLKKIRSQNQNSQGQNGNQDSQGNGNRGNQNNQN
jgi:hypothetical protein